MPAQVRYLWDIFVRQGRRKRPVTAPKPRETPRPAPPSLKIAPNDPIIGYFQDAPGVGDIDEIDLDSPALRDMKAAGVKVVVPLVSQGELIGLLNLGPRLSQQEYSADDRTLLSNLATQAAPAVRVAQLARQQQAEARERERIEHELRVAQLIQKTLLPKALPEFPGWQVEAYYQSAREVGGDFYDFLALPEDRLGLVVGDVTGKGVPAALVMATTRSVVRGAAQRSSSPGEVLKQANELLHPDIPPNMFITCLYAILEPDSGRLRCANAGHHLPYVRHGDDIVELRATGMPLGLMPEANYEEKETLLEPGDSVLCYSDGLLEAHNSQREMFGFERLRELLAENPTAVGAALVDLLLAELARFTGDNWEQEDDITLLTIQREGRRVAVPKPSARNGPWRILVDFDVPSEPGNERQAMEQVAEAVREFNNLSPRRLERLKTAVAEATMNAMEHGNDYRPELPVAIRVLASETNLVVRVSDQGKGQPIPEPESPDLEAKLSDQQVPRGWGLFLIENMVDEIRVTSDEAHHIVELVMRLEGGEDHAGE